MSRWDPVARELGRMNYTAPRWGAADSLVPADGRNFGRQDWRRRDRRGSTSPSREDGELSESLRREESPTSENIHNDVPLSPEQREDDNSGERNRTERIESLQSSLKSAFDDMQADLVRVERKNKELTEENKKLKEELKKAKEREQNLEETRNKLRELRNTFAAVKEEFDEVCDQRGPADQRAAKKRKYVLKVFEVDDLLNCSICLEPWAQSGEHIVCSLSCGHFFGKSCITKWISKDQSRGYSTCPTCSRRVTLSDIRHHYVSQIYEE